MQRDDQAKHSQGHQRENLLFLVHRWQGGNGVTAEIE
jgi:hypothetical protein